MRLCRASLAIALLAMIASAAVHGNDASPAALIEDGHWKRARAALEPMVQSNPNDVQALYQLSKVRQAFGDHRGALSLAEKAATLDPRNAEIRAQVANAVCELADEERSFGLARRCKKEFEAAVALDPRQVDARWGLMEFNMQAPWIVGGSKDRARQLLAEIKQIDPVRGYFAEVRMNQMEKRQVSPEPLYQQALQRDASSYRARMSLAEFYASDAQKKYEVSEKLAREAMQLRPGRAHAYSFLASLFAHLNRWQDLDALLAQAETNIPDNLTPYYNAARVLAVAGKELPRAERYLRKYLTVEPEAGAPTHAHAHWRLSLVLEKSGRKADAISALETALRLNPGLEDARKDLKRLKG